MRGNLKVAYKKKKSRNVVWGSFGMSLQIPEIAHVQRTEVLQMQDACQEGMAIKDLECS